LTCARTGAAIYNHALIETQLQRMFGAGVGITGNFPPSFATQPPATNTTYPGFTLQISATSSGTTPITNQWQFNGTNLVDGIYNGALITGSTSNVLTIAGITTNNQGVYNLVLSNPVTSVASSNAVVTLLSTVAPPGPANLIGAWLNGVSTYDVACRLRIPEKLVRFFIGSGHNTVFKRVGGITL
jgi:hypothetical protein